MILTLFLSIWGLTVTMPTALLAKNFPLDVQECLRQKGVPDGNSSAITANSR